MTMARWCDNDGAIEHHFIAIVPLHHRHRVIAIALSYQLTRHRHRTIVSSHHRVIATSIPTQWCDGELRGPIRIP